jgi:hypothetical protein
MRESRSYGSVRGAISDGRPYRDTLARNWPYNLEQMESMSKADALNLASKWERQSQPISVFCFSSTIALTAKHGKVSMCLDECIDLRLADDTALRIFVADAAFSSVEPRDMPPESVNLLPKFQNGIRVALQGEQMQWFLLA